MSLVGTRPILQDELLKYELHHRARIAIKPGITGMWQVSGRSDITDFEEVVRLDTEYISNWNFGLDRLSDTKQCWQANLEAPTKRSEQRDEFWNDYQRKGVDFVMKKYGTTPLKTKIKNKLVKLISIGGGQTLNPDLIYYVDYSERRAA